MSGPSNVNGPPAFAGGQILNMMTTRVVATDDPADFEKQVNTLTRTGWQPMPIQTSISYDQEDKKHKFAFLCMFMKQGVH